MTFYICNHNLDLQKKGNSKLKGSDTDKPCTWPLQPRTCTRLDYTGFFGKQLLHFTYIYIYLYWRIIFISWTILYIPQTLQYGEHTRLSELYSAKSIMKCPYLEIVQALSEVCMLKMFQCSFHFHFIWMYVCGSCLNSIKH